VTDPEVCHGQPTFRGTRILVADVLEQVANGTAWECIKEEWRGSVTEEAIAEAVRLASEAFRGHAHELGLEPASARTFWTKILSKANGSCCEAGAFPFGRLVMNSPERPFRTRKSFRFR